MCTRSTGRALPRPVDIAADDPPNSPAAGAATCSDVPMVKAVHRICPACECPTSNAEVLPEPRTLVCDRCGAVTPIEPLAPLLFVTGSSGAGKTTLYRHLVGRVREAILIDQDLLWSVSPAHDDPASDYRAFRGLTLHLAERLALNGRPVVIEGTTVPDQIETLGERWYFSHTAYLAVVCDDQELRSRLAARPNWRSSRLDADRMIEANNSFRTVAFDPPMKVLDTTGRTIEDAAAELYGWILAETASWRQGRGERTRDLRSST